MRVIHARNINDAFLQGMKLLKEEGVPQDSRAGPVLVMDSPVTTVYEKPCERVLFHAGRDANPFFHIMEALWLLAGRNDATWLDRFVGDFSKRFAEEDGRQHGSYGFRWRHHFDLEGGGAIDRLPDQLDTIVRLLKENPDDRRVVLAMWDPVSDLDVSKRDICCNTHAYFRVRGEHGSLEKSKNFEFTGVMSQRVNRVLDLTVCCRSNDMIFGGYGANSVHFSILLEYMAARIGVGVGKYYQVSNNCHIYTNVLGKIDLDLGPEDLYQSTHLPAHTTPLVDDPDTFDLDLRLFMVGSDSGFNNLFFKQVAVPMKRAYALWRAKRREEALDVLTMMPPLSDWKVASECWFKRRMVKGEAKSEEGVVR